MTAIVPMDCDHEGKFEVYCVDCVASLRAALATERTKREEVDAAFFAWRQKAEAALATEREAREKVEAREAQGVALFDGIVAELRQQLAAERQRAEKAEEKYRNQYFETVAGARAELAEARAALKTARQRFTDELLEVAAQNTHDPLHISTAYLLAYRNHGVIPRALAPQEGGET